jgi:hypothetical protein
MNAPLVRLSAIILLVLFAAFTPQLSAADAQKADGELLTRYFQISRSCLHAMEDYSGEWPLILDGLEDTEATRVSTARKFLEEQGVAFPPGAAAIYYAHSSLLGVKNTAENILKVWRIANLADVGAPNMIRIEVRVMEYEPDSESKLSGQGTFADLEHRLAGSVTNVCNTSILSKNGQRASARIDNGIAKAATSPENKRKNQMTSAGIEDWPPPAGVQRTLLEVEPVMTPNGETLDAQISFRYAAPASAKQPAIRAEIATNFEVKEECILTLKTFTVSDPKKPDSNPRHYAILLRCQLENTEGKGTAQRKDEAVQRLKKAKGR